MIDLLSPVGDFDCLKSAVQNGANSVYFGSNLFSARAYASNFDSTELEKAITYARTRGVKTNLTLNTLVTDNEFDDAFEVAKQAYEFGIDAIIVQDLGLAKKLIEAFPDLAIHASTQMTIHNLQGVLEMQKLGFKRVVLARELSLHEIEYICQNSDIEIECFIHGALCISYSGQCLFSSMIGGRSGNRGKCAQPCRLPYKLLENNKENKKDKVIDNGYLLSTRDLCGLDYIPSLIKAGVNCLKIEGRMKNPEYVATVTRIYRKYIDLANSDSEYIVDEADRKALLQAFNRGMFSCGHLSNEPNRDLIYKEKPNNMGLYLGKVEKYNKQKGHITVRLQEPIQIGDTIALEKEKGSYNISEIMVKNKNIKETLVGQTVTIGRMKGNINLGDNIYKMSSKKLNTIAIESLNKENRKIPLNCFVKINQGKPIQIKVTLANSNDNSNYLDIYNGLDITYISDTIPEQAKSIPLSKEKVLSQINKTTDSIFEFKNIDLSLDDDIFIPISSINDLRRNILDKAYNYAISKIRRVYNDSNVLDITDNLNNNIENQNENLKVLDSKFDDDKSNKKISVLLNILNSELDYSNLNSFDNVYIPLKYFVSNQYSGIIKRLEKKFNIYIYMPTILKANYRNLFLTNIENTIKDYKINGFVVSNISNLKLLENLIISKDGSKNNNFEIIANYTFNVFNLHTVNELKNLGINKFTISPESTKEIIENLCNNSKCELSKELIVYGNTPLMNMNYCPLGKTNKCYPTCETKCISSNKYYLKDRLGMNFRILFDNIQTVSTIYNCKTASISSDDYNADSIRIDILDENIKEINNIIDIVKKW